MKKMFYSLIMCVLLINTYGVSQIWYSQGAGLISSDTCDFSTLCDFSGASFLYNWEISTNGSWEIGNTTKPFFSSNGFNQRALMTDTLSAYAINDTSFFEISIFMGHDEAMWWPYTVIEFEHKYNTDTLMDGGFITISFDDGDTWVNMGELVDYEGWSTGYNYSWLHKHNLYTDADTLFNGISSFSGSSSDWVFSGFQFVFAEFIKSNNVSEYLLIRFNFISDTVDNQKDGWIIRKLILSIFEPNSSVESYEYNTTVSIYPNPVNETFTIDFKDYLPKETFEVEIINNLGQVVKRFQRNTINENSFSIADLNAGLYSLKITENDKVLSISKLIKE